MLSGGFLRPSETAWQAYAGAEPFGDDSPPLFADLPKVRFGKFEEAMLILDGCDENGMTLSVSLADPESGFCAMALIPFSGIRTALAGISAVSNRDDLEKLGFVFEEV